MLNSSADGTSVSLLLGCKSVVGPLVEDLFINHANGPGRLSRPLHECHLLDCSTFLEVGPHSFTKQGILTNLSFLIIVWVRKGPFIVLLYFIADT